MFNCMPHWYILNWQLGGGESYEKCSLLASNGSVSFSLALQDECSFVSLKHQKPLTQLHNVTSQETGILIDTSVKTSHLTLCKFTNVSVCDEFVQYVQSVRFHRTAETHSVMSHTFSCWCQAVSIHFSPLMCISGLYKWVWPHLDARC
jgi:hypothetical protein